MDNQQIEDLGDAHVSTNSETPLRSDAFVLSEDEKIAQIQEHFAQIMQTLGLDLTDDSLSGTPYRFAKMTSRSCFTVWTQRCVPSCPLSTINTDSERC